MQDSNIISGIVTDDPLAQLPIGASFPLEPVTFIASAATLIPQGASNWGFFEGAILAVIVRTAEKDTVVGTAAVIAPGLAISATHVLRDHLAEVLAGTASLSCIGPATAGLDFWRVRKLSMCDENDDIVYLSIELGSAISTEWRFRTFALTTRAPTVGETLHVVGFQFPTVFRDLNTNEVKAAGNLYIAAGLVVAVYPSGRDPRLLPYASIEVACGTLNGMSGGAVLNADGRLVGVISRGWDFADGKGPSYAAWIVGALNRSVEIPWPPGVYPQPVKLLDIDSRAMPIEGRDRITVLNDRQSTYKVWFE